MKNINCKLLHSVCIVAFMLFAFSQKSNAQLEGTSCEIMFSNCEEELVEYLYQNIGVNNCFQWESTCSTNSDVFRTGKVGIGTNTVPSSATLGVKGGIVTNLITVELCETQGWCDYVFEPDYHLLSLKEVNDCIQEAGHLPNTPSAQEIESEGGFELKSIKLNHQEKIEEIFLHLIQIQKRVNNLKDEIASLEAENKKLKTEKK